MKRTVFYTPRAFLVDGRPVVLTSACIHFFRVPRELWRDRIQKARLGGMNTIETYVAWNFHEAEEGHFDFTGDRDLDEFLSECERQNMFVIVRPGPYICAEWDFGGLPAWLTKLANFDDPRPRIRSDDREYLRYVDRYLDHVIPIIAKHQWTRGGGVILVQVENEYNLVSAARGEGAERYMRHLRDGFRARGIEVPLITCVGRCEGCVECINGHYPAQLIPDMRRRQPDAPLFSTEFWSAWYDVWGGNHNTRSAEDIARASMDFWAMGGCGYNYYVYHGGTNFGYTPMYLQTTSYDYDAQVSETGGLTPKYFASKRIAQWARAFSDILTTATEDDPEKVHCDPCLSVRLRRSEHGAVAFLDNPTDTDITTDVTFEDVKLGGVLIPSRQIRPLVFGARLSPNVRLRGANAEIVSLVRAGDITRVLVSGAAGAQAVFELAVQGTPQQLQVNFPAEGPSAKVSVSDVEIIALSEPRADKAWILPTRGKDIIVIGSDFVRTWRAQSGKLTLEVEFRPGTHLVEVLTPTASTTQTLEVSDDRPQMPRLEGWQVALEPREYAPDFDDSSWRYIDRPTSMIALGNGSEAYGWYRAKFTASRAGAAKLHFANCADRLTVWINGERVGPSQPPPENRQGAWTADFRVWLKAGENSITVLADNLGLIKGDWQIGGPQEWERKGIFGDVLIDGRPVTGWRFIGRLYGERAGWYHPDAPDVPWRPLGDPIPAAPTWYRVEFDLPVWPWPVGWPLTVAPKGLSKGVMWLNGRNLGRYWTIGPQKQWYLPEPWLKRRNVLVIVDEEGCLPVSVAL
ncbi:MAG: beta-galactosidase, partial [Armatimonadota bacterium]